MPKHSNDKVRIALGIGAINEHGAEVSAVNAAVTHDPGRFFQPGDTSNS